MGRQVAQGPFGSCGARRWTLWAGRLTADAGALSKYQFRRILIVTDGSDSADSALDVAASLALVSEQAQVRVVHVWRLEVHHRHGIWDTELRRSAEELLGHAVVRLRELGVEADTELERSDELHVAPAIVEAARRFQADLVVVGSRGFSNWRALLHQSVGHELMAHLECPLLLVRAWPAAAEHPKRILVAIGDDDEVGSEVAVAAAAAHPDGSKVLVVHLLTPGAESKRETVDRAIDTLSEAGIEADGWLLRPGPVADAIADAAGRWGADIVVMGPARPGDVGSLLFESVIHDLLRETSPPVLVAARSHA